MLRIPREPVRLELAGGAEREDEVEDGGVGAEVAALVTEHAFDALRAPVKRVTGPDAPAPASYALEQAFMPQARTIVDAAMDVVMHGERETALA